MLVTTLAVARFGYAREPPVEASAICPLLLTGAGRSDAAALPALLATDELAFAVLG